MCDIGMLLRNFFLYSNVDQLDLNVLTHSIPTRRSSDLHGHGRAAAGGKVDHRVARPTNALDGACIDGWIPGGSPVSGTRAWRLMIDARSEEHTSELQSLMRISYAVFCLNKTKSNS